MKRLLLGFGATALISAFSFAVAALYSFLKIKKSGEKPREISDGKPKIYFVSKENHAKRRRAKPRKRTDIAFKEIAVEPQIIKSEIQRAAGSSDHRRSRW